MDEHAYDRPGADSDEPLLPAERGGRPRALFIACGALGRELVDLKRATGWAELTITCLPAHWHNTPQKIAPAVLRKIRVDAGPNVRQHLLSQRRSTP